MFDSITELAEGDNDIPDHQGDGYKKTINVEPIWDCCYKIQMTNWTQTIPGVGTTWNGIVFSFNKSMLATTEEKNLPVAQVRLTSKYNYIPFFGQFYDGTELTYTLENGQSYVILISASLLNGE